VCSVVQLFSLWCYIQEELKVKFLTKLLHSGTIARIVFTDIINRELASLSSNVIQLHYLLWRETMYGWIYFQLVVPERIWNCGQIFLVVLLHFFGSTNTISRLDERFPNGQYSLVSFLFAVLLLTVPPHRTQSFVKVGACAPRALWSRRHSFSYA